MARVTTPQMGTQKPTAWIKKLIDTYPMSCEVYNNFAYLRGLISPTHLQLMISLEPIAPEMGVYSNNVLWSTLQSKLLYVYNISIQFHTAHTKQTSCANSEVYRKKPAV